MKLLTSDFYGYAYMTTEAETLTMTKYVDSTNFVWIYFVIMFDNIWLLEIASLFSEVITTQCIRAMEAERFIFVRSVANRPTKC